MKKWICVLTTLLFVAFLSGCSSHKVTRIDSEQVTDLSGRWNDTDSRLVSNEMITDMLAHRWIPVYEGSHGKRPVVIVGTVLNKSHEHHFFNLFLIGLFYDALSNALFI